MKNIAISFSSFIRSFVKGAVDLHEVQKFKFGCSRRHLFPLGFNKRAFTVPREIAGLQNDLVRILDPEYVFQSEFAKMRIQRERHRDEWSHFKLEPGSGELDISCKSRGEGYEYEQIDRLEVDENLLAVYDRFWDCLNFGSIETWFRDTNPDNESSDYYDGTQMNYNCQVEYYTERGHNVFYHGEWHMGKDLKRPANEVQSEFSFVTWDRSCQS